MYCQYTTRSKLQGLWDTGAQVSVICMDQVVQPFHKKKNLFLTANGTPKLYSRFIEVELALNSGGDGNTCVIVPFLVTTDTLELPVIGFNTIYELIKDKDGISEVNDQKVMDISWTPPTCSVSNAPNC